MILLEKIVFSLFLIKKLISKELLFYKWLICIKKAVPLQPGSAILFVKTPILG